MKKKRMIAICISMVLLFLTAGCSSNTTLEAGFNENNAVHPGFFAAYKSDKNIFDINDVTLTFYYGSFHNQRFAQTGENETYNIVFYFYSLPQNSAKLEKTLPIKTISAKDFYTDKYFGLEYSEILTVPESLFFDEIGTVVFGLQTEYILANGEKADWCLGGGVGLYYIKDGDKITLYDDWALWQDQWAKGWRD